MNLFRTIAVSLFLLAPLAHAGISGDNARWAGAIDNDWNAMLPRHGDDLFHRQNLTREIDDVAHQDQLGAWRDVLLEQADDLVIVLCRNRDRELRQLDALASFPLLPGRNHPTVVLVRRQDLIAGLEVKPQLADL